MNMTDEESRVHPLGRVLPTRKFKTSSRPWVTGSKKTAEKRWNMPKVEWSDLEKTMMLAEMTRIGVIVMMNTHLFRRNGKIFLQGKGWSNRVKINMCGG